MLPAANHGFDKKGRRATGRFAEESALGRKGLVQTGTSWDVVAATKRQRPEDRRGDDPVALVAVQDEVAGLHDDHPLAWVGRAIERLRRVTVFVSQTIRYDGGDSSDLYCTA